MIWLVLFKLQRYSRVGNTAVVRCQQKGTGKKKQGKVKIYLFNESAFASPDKPKIACIKHHMSHESKCSQVSLLDIKALEVG